MNAEERLQSLNLTLPTVPKPLGMYLPVVQFSSFLFVSGTLPIDEKGQLICGTVGEDMDIPQAQKAARLAALNAIAALRNHLGDLNKIQRIVRAVGHINATPTFTGHAQVMNGASEILGEIFGDTGRHARLALGSASLPKNAAVELEVIAGL